MRRDALDGQIQTARESQNVTRIKQDITGDGSEPERASR